MGKDPQTCLGARFAPVRWMAVAVATAMVAFAAPTLPLAKERFVKPTTAQQQLNDQAVEAALAGDIDKAVRLFRASLDLGELNVTHLNLGRSLFKAGRCKEAEEAYAATLTSPKVAAPSPADVAEIVERYRAELQETCPGSVEVACDGGQNYTVGGKTAPCGGTVSLPAGSYTVRAKFATGEAQQAVDITAMETVRISLEAPKRGPDDPPDESSEGISLSTWGYIVGGTGALLVLTGLIIDAAVIGPDFDEFEEAGSSGDTARYNELRDSLDSNQTLNLVVFVVGGLALATGGGLLLYDAGVFGGGESSSGASVTPWISDDGAGVTMGASF